MHVRLLEKCKRSGPVEGWRRLFCAPGPSDSSQASPSHVQARGCRHKLGKRLFLLQWGISTVTSLTVGYPSCLTGKLIRSLLFYMLGHPSSITDHETLVLPWDCEIILFCNPWDIKASGFLAHDFKGLASSVEMHCFVMSCAYYKYRSGRMKMIPNHFQYARQKVFQIINVSLQHKVHAEVVECELNAFNSHYSSFTREQRSLSHVRHKNRVLIEVKMFFLH